MSRININQLEKVEELPERVGLRKFIKTAAPKEDRDWYRMSNHGEHFYKVREQIMRGSIGQKWDTIVEKIKEKLPEGFALEHPWILKKPDVMKQSSENGDWYFVGESGDFERHSRTKASAENPTKLKRSSPYDRFYLNKEGILKWVKGTRKKREPEHKTPSQKRAEVKHDQLVAYLKSIADYSKIAQKQRTWKDWRVFEMENIKSISFKHPTKKQERRRYDKETNSWVGTGIYDPIDVTLTIPQFKQWCEKEGKTYFIFDGTDYHTNLKWSFKQ